jgi:hypothetical protein
MELILKDWLFTIMKNTFINNYRRLVKTNALITKSDDISSANLHYSATVNTSESKFIIGDIHKALVYAYSLNIIFLSLNILKDTNIMKLLKCYRFQ